jgi:hypothetical protein
MLPRDILEALNEQKEAIELSQSESECKKLEQEIFEIHEKIKKCTLRYQRRLKLDLQSEVLKLETQLENAKTGKLLQDFETKIKPMLSVYNQLSKLETKNVPKLVRFSSSSKDSEIVLEMRRHLIGKFKKVELQHALLGDFCDDCGVTMLMIASDSLLGCPKCAKTRAVPHASATSTMESDFVPNGTIKVKSRLIEWVQFSQAKECIEIDEKIAMNLTRIVVHDHFKHLTQEKILESIKDEYVQNGPYIDSENAVDRLLLKIPTLEKDLKSINGSMTRKAMQSLVSKGYGNVRKLYENAAKYSSIISGFWPRRFTSEQEDRIRRMFTLAAPVYHLDRLKSSTLTFKGGYPYWLRCICILNGWYEFLDHFPVKKELKSSEREMKRAEFWKKLNWEFVPSHPPLRAQLCLDNVTGKTFEIHFEDFQSTFTDVHEHTEFNENEFDNDTNDKEHKDMDSTVKKKDMDTTVKEKEIDSFVKEKEIDSFVKEKDMDATFKEKDMDILTLQKDLNVKVKQNDMDSDTIILNYPSIQIGIDENENVGIKRKRKDFF